MSKQIQEKWKPVFRPDTGGETPPFLRPIKELEPRRLARFVVVGVGANISLFVLSYLFRSLGIAAFVAGAGAYAITFVAAYTAQRGWTFGSTESHAKVFPRYLAAQIACAALSGLVGHVSVEIFALSPFWMSVAVTAVAAISSFFLSSLWVFAKGGEQSR